MTGKDLLDAIGYVDESLLERCQKKEQITAKNQTSLFWPGKKYVPIAACACLLIIILGITYRQYNFFCVGESLVTGAAQGMAASIDTCCPKEQVRLPKADGPNGTGSSIAKDTLNETEAEANSRYYPPDDVYQSDAGGLPEIKDSSGKESRSDTTPNSGNAGIFPSPDTQIVKNGDADGVSLKYSQGIKIEAVKEIPKDPEENPPSATSLQPEETLNPEEAEAPSVKKVLARDTAIIRGTVKNIQYFHVSGGNLDIYFSVVSLKVKEVYRTDGKGNPQKGSICKVYLPDTKATSRFGSSILGKIAKGREVIIMPYIADARTGIRKKGTFFAFSDVSDYYFNELTAESHLFLKTKTGVLYNKKIYDIPYDGKKATLDDVGEYIRKMLKKI